MRLRTFDFTSRCMFPSDMLHTNAVPLQEVSKGSHINLLKNCKQCRKPHEAEARLRGVAL